MNASSAESDRDPRLTQLIALIQQGDQQGIPLQRNDYLGLALLTIVVPALLIVIGALT